MRLNEGPQSIGEIFKKPRTEKKPPAHPWQELALQIIDQLSIPPLKRNSVFRVCKTYQRDYILKCFNDTKELCKTGEQWKYFFKLVEKK